MSLSLSRLLYFAAIERRRFRARLIGRKQNREPGAVAFAAGDVDAASVHFDDPGDKAEPQPEARYDVGLRAADAIETVENVRQIFRGNPYAGVFDDHLRPP